jgi:hypothetical protein
MCSHMGQAELLAFDHVTSFPILFISDLTEWYIHSFELVSFFLSSRAYSLRLRLVTHPFIIG